MIDEQTSSAIKQGQKAAWTAGNYPHIATCIQSAADATVAKAGAGPGVKLLDVATGTGNAAIPAAQAGADVTGLDLTPRLLEVARARAAEAGVTIEFVEGDAEALPFEDASFDRVTSVFGVMFAPRHEVAAGELARVCRPGGSISVTGWTPEGLNGQMFRTLGAYMPPPPEGARGPVPWGDEEYVRGLLQPLGLEVEAERAMVHYIYPSLDEAMAIFSSEFGPLVLARPALEEAGKWDSIIGDLRALFESVAVPDGEGIRIDGEYLLTHATRSG
jgi:SAM-dependent methyltransferase